MEQALSYLEMHSERNLVYVDVEGFIELLRNQDELFGMPPIDPYGSGLMMPDGYVETVARYIVHGLFGQEPPRVQMMPRVMPMADMPPPLLVGEGPAEMSEEEEDPKEDPEEEDDPEEDPKEDPVEGPMNGKYHIMIEIDNDHVELMNEPVA